MYNNLANTQFTGKSILFLPSCHSTNQLALDKIKSGESSNGLIVITNDQTAGRGQRGNTWLSEAEVNLTFSVIYHPEALDVRRSFYLNIVSSLAVAETLSHFLNKKQILVKWPNDVYCGEKKLSGILIETSIRQQNISSIVIGIGLNVNQQISRLPQAGSMIQEAQHPFELKEVFEQLIEHLEYYYLLLSRNELEKLVGLYHEKLYGLNQKRSFRDSTGIFNGVIHGITEAGQLIVEKEDGDGERYRYSFKEIEFLHTSERT